MPTGYTYPVGEGKITTLRDFALTCARGMGVCVKMRDDPMDAPLPEKFEPSTQYHDKCLSEARAALAELPTLTVTECDRRAAADYAEQLQGHQEYEAARQLENERYRSMREKVAAWEGAPEGIRSFMLEQLDISISDYNCQAPVCLSGPKWREAQIKRAAHDVAYHEKARAEEIERTRGRNEWLAQLRASLPVA